MISNSIIRNTKSWLGFSKQLNYLISNNKKLQAGKAYEHCVKFFLQTNPKYLSELKNVWLLDEVPKSIKEKLNLPDADEGIDLIGETYRKNYWSIQAKYKSDPSSSLTRKDLATFRDLSFNHCKGIEHALVCSPISSEPKKSFLMSKMGFVLFNEWEDLDTNNHQGWNNIKNKLKGKIIKPEKFKPKKHQKKAIKKVVKTFQDDSINRGKLIMPCGTGKSLTAFWITRDMKVNKVLVAIPSLSLLQQTLNVWTKEFLANNIRPDYLCVCSDESAGSLTNDEFTAQTYDLGIKTTTDEKEIINFLKDKSLKFKIIFTTYQSGQVTAKASKKAKFTFDLGIMDEAHKTVGHKLKPMAHLLYEKNIKITKRLFMTATERIYKGGKENEILSMDDPNDYGKIIFQMSYKEAIEAGIVSDYKIVSFNVSNDEYEQIIQNNEYIRTNKNLKQHSDLSSRELATALALRKAFKELNINKALSFHSSITRADKFEELNKDINRDFKKYPQLETFHVSSKQSTSKRTLEMRSFEKSDKSLITNARCLTEGVDVPAIDCVAFIDSKRSKIDIVQAAGRAMRISKGKKFGYILVPIISNDNDIRSASIDTDYEDLIAIISSLATQDDRLVDEIKLKSNKKVIKKNDTDILKMNISSLKKININNLNKEISLKIWKKISTIGYVSYDEAKKYVNKLNLNNVIDWNNFASSKERPIDIPSDPSRFYKFKGWVSWGDFLGHNRLSNYEKSKNFYSFNVARNKVRKLNIKNNDEWRIYLKSKDRDIKIPSSPKRVYEEFTSLGDWFGNNNIAPSKTKFDFNKSQVFIRKFVKNNNLKSVTAFRKKISSIKRPDYLPSSLDHSFGKHSKYIDFYHFSGMERPFIKKPISYNAAKSIVLKLNLKSSAEFHKKYNKLNLEKLNIPKNPDGYYKRRNSWKSWEDFIGYKNRGERPKKNFYSLSEIQKILIKNNIKKLEDYHKFRVNDDRMPFHPMSIYKEECKNLNDFFGKEKTRIINFIKYVDLKKIMRKNNIKDKNGYIEFRKKNKKILIPSNPIKIYFTEWEGWDEFLGYSKFVTYKEAKQFVLKNKISSASNYTEVWRKIGYKKKLPAKPYNTYKKHWISWYDFLNK